MDDKKKKERERLNKQLDRNLIALDKLHLRDQIIKDNKEHWMPLFNEKHGR